MLDEEMPTLKGTQVTQSKKKVRQVTRYSRGGDRRQTAALGS